MKDELKIQENYWDRESTAFEKIYNHEKSAFSNFLDRVFRKDMYERFVFTLENCEPVKSRSFLDAGCGNGLYSIELAKRGADHVLGVDIAANMLERCRRYAEQEQVTSVCEFKQTDLLALNTNERFDVSFGIGLFDYIRDPQPVIRRIKELTTGKVIASFPRYWTWRAPVRKVRLGLRGCPVYFFRKHEVERFFKQAGYARTEVSVVGKLFCVVGYC